MRLVIADHDKLERRHVGEEVAPHEAGGDGALPVSALMRASAYARPSYVSLAHPEIGRVLCRRSRR